MKRTWSDASLLQHSWRIQGRPDADPTISRDKPPTAAALQFIQDYDITPPRTVQDRHKAVPYVWCSLCQEATHWIGWVAEYEQGGRLERTLVGRNCASRKGGQVMRLAATAYKANQERSEHLRARQALLEIAGPVSKALHEWGSAPGIDAVMSWRSSLTKACGKLSKELADAASHSPPTLLVQVETRDHAAEESRARRKGSDTSPIYRSDYKVFARIEGAALYAGADPAVRISRLAERFDQAAAALARPSEGIKTRELGESLAQARNVADSAREIERAFAGYERGLTDQAIDTVLAWFKKLPSDWETPEALTRKGRVVIADRGAWQSPSHHSIPNAVPIVRPEILNGLEAALLGRTEPAVAA